MSSILSKLQAVKAVLFDMDGVVYVGDQPLPGVQEMLDYLDSTGRKWLFVTNNASRTTQQFADKVRKMGIRANPENILGSADATASWLAEQVNVHGWPRGKAIVNLLELQAGEVRRYRIAMGSDGLRLHAAPMLN